MKLYDITILLLSITICGCYTPRYVYSPTAHNVPVLNKKGDAGLAGYYSTSLATKSREASKNLKVKNNGLDVHAAYAYSKHGAFQFSLFSRNEINDGNFLTVNDSSTIHYRKFMAEAGIGVYRPMDSARRFNFQVFVGVGLGRYQFTDNNKASGTFAENYFKTSAFKFYIQPSISVNPLKNFYSSVSSRFSLVKFHDIRTDYSQDLLNKYKLDSIGLTPTFFWEPAFINSIGFKKIPGFRLEVQAGLAFLLTSNFVDARPFNFSAGIYIDPVQIFGLKKATGDKP